MEARQTDMRHALYPSVVDESTVAWHLELDGVPTVIGLEAMPCQFWLSSEAGAVTTDGDPYIYTQGEDASVIEAALTAVARQGGRLVLSDGRDAIQAYTEWWEEWEIDILLAGVRPDQEA